MQSRRSHTYFMVSWWCTHLKMAQSKWRLHSSVQIGKIQWDLVIMPFQSWPTCLHPLQELYLSCQVLQDCSAIHSSCGSYTPMAGSPRLQVPVDAANRELENNRNMNRLWWQRQKKKATTLNHMLGNRIPVADVQLVWDYISILENPAKATVCQVHISNFTILTTCSSNSHKGILFPPAQICKRSKNSQARH